MTQDPQVLATIPPVIASYAAYLQARTRAAPNVAIKAGHAEVSSSNGSRTLVVTFEYRGLGWSPATTELSDGDHSTTFCQGELAIAVTALLRP